MLQIAVLGKKENLGLIFYIIMACLGLAVNHAFISINASCYGKNLGFYVVKSKHSRVLNLSGWGDEHDSSCGRFKIGLLQAMVVIS